MSKIHITIPEDLKERVKQIAEKKGRSINYVVNEALTRYTSKFKK